MSELVNITDLVNKNMTKEVQQLLDKAKSLSSKEIEFKEMTGDLLIQSDGAAITLENGQEIIYLDPKRVNEYLIAHELSHVILHRSGWPCTYSTLSDNFIVNLANHLDNSLDHYVFFPRLDSTINVSHYQDKIIKRISDWPKKEAGQDAILWNSFYILDVFSFGKKYEDQIKKTLKDGYPKTLALAKKLDEVRTSNGKGKIGIQKSMSESLKIIEDFLKKEGLDIELHKIVCVSPLFTNERLLKPVKDITYYIKDKIIFNGVDCRVDLLGLISDNTNFLVLLRNGKSPSPKVRGLKKKWKKEDTKTFFESTNLPYGIRE